MKKGQSFDNTEVKEGIEGRKWLLKYLCHLKEVNPTFLPSLTILRRLPMKFILPTSEAEYHYQIEPLSLMGLSSFKGFKEEKLCQLMDSVLTISMRYIST